MDRHTALIIVYCIEVGREGCVRKFVKLETIFRVKLELTRSGDKNREFLIFCERNNEWVKK